MKNIDLKLIPQPKEIKFSDEIIEKQGIRVLTDNIDYRIKALLEKIPLSENGIGLKIEFNDKNLESYNLKIAQEEISVKADGIRGAFYALQTLRQIFENDYVPCCEINDKPDFEYRGAYLDITRGKVPKLETIKNFIDKIAYYKMNSLQLYVEHTYEFKEYADNLERTGYITSEELKEIDKYCKDNFIEFIPSLATFGHLYELLQKDRYKHLRMLDEYEPKHHMWLERHLHHTLDPVNPESFELVKSLIDQYEPNFTSEWFNICCDETFDLTNPKNTRYNDKDKSELYVEFVSKIINYLKDKGKRTMMWGDILLNHPDKIERIPEDTVFLNWFYRENPLTEQVEKFYAIGRNQILCVGTSNWARYCENIDVAMLNIENMTRLGYQFGVKGTLTSLWGDYGNAASLALSECSFAYGADRVWNIDVQKEDIFSKVDKLVYKAEGLSGYAKELSKFQTELPWIGLILLYEDRCMGIKHDFPYYAEHIMLPFIAKCKDYIERLEKEPYDNEHKKEMLVCAEGFIVMAEIAAIQNGSTLKRCTDTTAWMKKYRDLWLSNNKESELKEIENLFNSLEVKGKA